eukprot:m.24431 g.24431  ORF g.24431 m.24431 type:complete len:64 (-) comp7605_c0_seq2:170-361(-)
MQSTLQAGWRQAAQHISLLPSPTSWPLCKPHITKDFATSLYFYLQLRLIYFMYYKVNHHNLIS